MLALPARYVERPRTVGAQVAKVIGGPAADRGRVVMLLLGRRDLGNGRHCRFRRKLPPARTCFDGSF
jgi:hypothetical protein